MAFFGATLSAFGARGIACHTIALFGRPSYITTLTLASLLTRFCLPSCQARRPRRFREERALKPLKQQLKVEQLPNNNPQQQHRKSIKLPWASQCLYLREAHAATRAQRYHPLHL